ncbi:hypothetical protein LPJ61_004792 [Coemansia biformis]|uniref:Alpha/beta hydrolase fold-3 domain-containing protein n=1 Tax=Coemansia biformis TaxID=1286918 RepID=A0A9W7YA38_9FUNG|nr:hypothetical protein LPJ61_004792 [Coemansia biformis]
MAPAPRDAALALAALASLATVFTMSTARYFLLGPDMPSWEYGVQLSRDVIRFLSRTSPTDPACAVVYQASNRYWPVFSQLLPKPSAVQTDSFAIPAYPLDDADLASAGVWAAKLTGVADASRNLTLPAESILASDAANVTDPATRGRAILYFHGGAYVSGSLESYRETHTRMSRASGLRVYGFEYRLAPAFQYPTQLYDAFCAFRHMRELGYADQDIIFAGDSAGGNLVLALWQLLRPPIPAMVLLSPRVDVTSSTPSWKTFAGIDVLDPYVISDPNSSIHQLLLPPGAELTPEVLGLLADPFIAPVHANLTGLPPTLVQVGTAEVMSDDIRAFVSRANAQNSTGPQGSVELQQYLEMFHVFQASPIVTPRVDRAWDAVGAFVRSLGST